ncbi:hypothetical protein HYH02_002646 [Chlamydomonas schloesseri]|uniref:Transmembrane protein 135 N-terminal domain-containing protein n=1 Tax=Chlamydomonas schloesseri TaxID=2026947 RepID=A0A835WSA8_9CHLO|nr:hypothetical protein HYH02_002646 [Chlamydomonas schloesseri]|eukprot:KAG2452403.1 hypothetical protein HYH02_002646 [Chlamydomonas schloesseri]
MYLISRLRGLAAARGGGGGRLRGQPVRQRASTLADAAGDTVLHTVFLAALGGGYTAVDEGIALVLGKESTQRWRALVAGLVAGQTLRLTGPHRRHYSLATYVLLRGLTLLVRTGNKPSAPPALRALLQPTRAAHGDTLLMCAAASQILYSFIMEPSTLPPSYVRFITRMGGKEPFVWAAIREHALRNAAGLAPGPLQALAGTPLAGLNAAPGRLRRTPCQFFHPGQSCASHALSVVPPAYAASLGVYVPFYLVSALLVHRAGLLQRPGELLPKIGLGVARSSAFLAGYIALAFGGACCGFHAAGVNTGAVIAGSVWAGGLAVLAEKKSRRMELAMYCAARALEAFIRCCWLWGWAGASGHTGAHSHRTPHPAGPGLGAARRSASSQHPPLSLPPLLPPPGMRAPGALMRPAHSTAAGGGAGPRRPGAAAAAAPGSGVSWLPLPERLDVLLFAAGCGAIMHCYSDCRGQHRDVFRSKYLNVLDFIFGNEGVQAGAITHVPTNRELVGHVRRRIRSMSMSMLSTTASTAFINPGSGGPSGSVAAGGAAAGGGGPLLRGDYSPLLQSAAQSHADGLYGLRNGAAANGNGAGGGWRSRYGAGGGAAADASAADVAHVSSSAGFGPGQHGGGGYAAYLRMQAGGGGGGGGGGRLPPPAIRRDSDHSFPSMYDDASRNASMTAMPYVGVAAGAATVAAAALRTAAEGGSQPVSPVQGLTGAAGSEAAAAAAAATAAASTAAATATAAAAAAASRSAGGASSSGEDSGWEDVWAHTMTMTTHAGTTTSSTAAGGQGGHGVGAGSAAPRGHIAAAAAGPAAEGPAAAAAPGGGSTGALGWAARLVAGALGRTASGGGAAATAAGSSSALTAAVAAEATAAAAAGEGAGSGRRHRGGLGGPFAATAGVGGSGGGGGSFMRRVSTAPLALTSPEAIMLLSDPSSERRGRGRDSYAQLQLLSGSFDEEGGGAAGPLAGAGGSWGGALAGRGGGGAFTIPGLAEVEAAAAEAARLSSSVPAASPLSYAAAAASAAAVGTAGAAAASAVAASGRIWIQPHTRAVPVPVPNASSRTPAFRPSAPAFSSSAGSATAALSSSLRSPDSSHHQHHHHHHASYLHSNSSHHAAATSQQHARAQRPPHPYPPQQAQQAQQQTQRRAFGSIFSAARGVSAVGTAPPAGGSVASGLDQLAARAAAAAAAAEAPLSMPSFSSGGSTAAAAAAAAAERGSGSGPESVSSPGGVTLDLQRSAWSHPSPVRNTAVWPPRVSLDAASAAAAVGVASSPRAAVGSAGASGGGGAGGAGASVGGAGGAGGGGVGLVAIGLSLEVETVVEGEEGEETEDGDGEGGLRGASSIEEELEELEEDDEQMEVEAGVEVEAATASHVEEAAAAASEAAAAAGGKKAGGERGGAEGAKGEVDQQQQQQEQQEQEQQQQQVGLGVGSAPQVLLARAAGEEAEAGGGKPARRAAGVAARGLSM